MDNVRKNRNRINSDFVYWLACYQIDRSMSGILDFHLLTSTKFVDNNLSKRDAICFFSDARLRCVLFSFDAPGALFYLVKMFGNFIIEILYTCSKIYFDLVTRNSFGFWHSCSEKVVLRKFITPKSPGKFCSVCWLKEICPCFFLPMINMVVACFRHFVLYSLLQIVTTE